MFRATTILAVKKDGKTAIGGDGQVTLGETTVMKHTAEKVRTIYNGKVAVGFAGSVADAFELSEKFEAKLSNMQGIYRVRR
jgi:ATP-dependent HslUV protease subunit HslV